MHIDFRPSQGSGPNTFQCNVSHPFGEPQVSFVKVQTYTIPCFSRHHHRHLWAEKTNNMYDIAYSKRKSYVV